MSILFEQDVVRIFRSYESDPILYEPDEESNFADTETYTNDEEDTTHNYTIVTEYIMDENDDDLRLDLSQELGYDSDSDDVSKSLRCEYLASL